MNTHTKLSNQTKKKKGGFTLIEVIAVLVLLGILAAIAVPQYVNMADTARQTAIDAGIAELNAREALTWGNALLTGIPADITTVAAATDLGGDYTVTATNINFDGVDQTVARTAASTTAPAIWARN